MKRRSKKLILITVSSAIFLTAGGALYVASNARYGARYESMTTPYGKKVNSDGALILVNDTLAEEEKSVILTMIAEEIRWKRPSYITHNYIDKSEFTLEHVRNAFYQFGSKYGIADSYDWVKDREKANSIVTSFYGVNPNFENGNSYNWFEMNLNGVTNIDSGYKMLSVDDNNIIFWDFADGDT